MAMFKLRLNVRTKNADVLFRLWTRLQDFSPVFANIVSEWAAGNALKFEAARGAEQSGVEQPPVHWQPLSEEYFKEKHDDVEAIWHGNRKPKLKKGTPENWLMVRTGELRLALTSETAFAQFVDAHRVVFGTPLSAEEADKALYNRRSRPTIFLGRSDRQMIRREVSRYLNFGEGYKEVLFSKSARLAAIEDESIEMDAGFSEATEA